MFRIIVLEIKLLFIIIEMLTEFGLLFITKIKILFIIEVNINLN